MEIDSIKRVEIVSAIQDQLGVEAKDVEALSQARTVGEVMSAVIRELSSGGSFVYVRGGGKPCSSIHGTEREGAEEQEEQEEQEKQEEQEEQEEQEQGPFQERGEKQASKIE